MSLFELRKTPRSAAETDANPGLIGAGTIKVLAIEAIATTSPGHAGLGGWAREGIANLYVCVLDGKTLARIPSADLWADIDDGCYEYVVTDWPPTTTVCP